MDKIIIQKLKTKCIIGDYVWERKRPQWVFFDLEVMIDTRPASRKDRLSQELFDYNKMAKEILQFVEKSAYQLIETLAEAVASLCLKKFPIQSITVRLTKPSAIKAADAAIVEITRDN